MFHSIATSSSGLEKGENDAHFVELVHALSQAHLFVSGGGGLFQDVSGPMNSFYYGGMIALARYFEVPVCFWGQGIGPLQLPATEWITTQSLRWSELICVRDDNSAQIAEHLLSNQRNGKQKIITATDPVWLVDPPAPAPETVHHTDGAKSWIIGISLRPSPDLTPENIDAFAVFLKRFIEDSAKPVQLLLLPFQQEEDTPVLRQLEQALLKHNAGSFSIVDHAHVVDHLQQCHILFGMRFHSIVLATLADVAVYGLVYDPKVRQLLKQLGLQGSDVSELKQLAEARSVENLKQYFQRYPAPDLEPIINQAKVNLEVLDRALLDSTAELEVLL